LVSEGRRGNAQRAARSDALDSEGLEPKLIPLCDRNDEHDLLPISEPKRLRHRIMNHNLKVSAFLEVLPDASQYCIGQVFAIVILPTLPRIEDSVSHSIPVMKITCEFEIA
jgi:hypothetical protein